MMQKLAAGSQTAVQRDLHQKGLTGEGSPALAIASEGSKFKSSHAGSGSVSPGAFGKLVGEFKHDSEAAPIRLLETSNLSSIAPVTNGQTEQGTKIAPLPSSDADEGQLVLSLLSSQMDPFVSLKISEKRQPASSPIKQSISTDAVVEDLADGLPVDGKTIPLVLSSPDKGGLENKLSAELARVETKPVELTARGPIQSIIDQKAVTQVQAMPPALTTTDAPRPAEQIAKVLPTLNVVDIAASQTTGSRSSVTVQLAPHHLGQVAMTLRQVGAVVEVRIVADSTSGLAALQSDENALKQVLRALPIEQVRLDISLRDDGSNPAVARGEANVDQARSNGVSAGERGSDQQRSTERPTEIFHADPDNDKISEIGNGAVSVSQTLV